MDHNNALFSFLAQEKELVTRNRPLRLRLAHSSGLMEDVLLPQRISGSEAVCGGVEYRVLCVSLNAHLPLKELIALPAAIDIVTDRGDVRSVCGIVSQASAGESDGGLASYQLVVRDALGILEKRINTRVFRQKSEVQIIRQIVEEWRQTNAVLAHAFRCESGEGFDEQRYPPREFTMQYNESDAAFIRRLMRRRGIAWHFRSLPDAQPVHALVMFDTPHALRRNAAGAVRYHRDAATEERDSITTWCAVRTIQPGSVARHSWNYRNLQPTFMQSTARSDVDQGPSGSTLCASLEDYQILPPHVGDNHDDLCSLGLLRMRRHDYESKCFHGQGSVRDFCAGEYFTLDEHPEIDTHAESERDFVVTALHLRAENNLPQALSARVAKLFAHQRWHADADGEAPFAASDATGPTRTRIHFTAVRLGTDIVPAYDPRNDLPHVRLQSAIVTGPKGEEVHCDALGRVKIRFPGMRQQDHTNGPGASGTDADSAWVRVVSSWAGDGMGSIGQCGSLSLPRAGSEVLVDFLGGDPDKPVIVGQLYNENARPPALSKGGGLPGNRYLSGLKSREIRQGRANQLRFDDTEGQISAQLASDHGDTQLNLGYLSTSREEGQAAPRGEGAELRSDHAISVRGSQGVLISAESEAHDAHLARAGLLGLTGMLKSFADELGTLAATHSQDNPNGLQLAALIEKLERWSSGTAQPSGAPIVAVSAPAGMVLGSQESIAVGAQTKVDILCAGDTQVSTGKNLLMRAAESISLFAYKLGVKLIAAHGDIVIETHQGNVAIKSARRISLDAAEGIDLRAPEIKVLSKGAQTDWGAGAITHQCTGAYVVKSATFAKVGPGGGSPAGLTFPRTDLNTDERVVLRDRQTLLPLKNQAYTARHEDGSEAKGITDGEGGTHLIKSKMMGQVEITVHRAANERGPNG
ncbi:type VI secretion system Vgr family protein [Massilia sp. erpn]|uniref:type VI secretion system Vgr family protein n=1 Tax=Massilia sp. erpn TaxID=2738142 RepID=UPI002107AE1F|nr:type VI secretion system Vgr family protein [Massilia sp. erpn]